VHTKRVTPTRPPPNLRKNISKRKNKGRTKGDSGMNQIKNAEEKGRASFPDKFMEQNLTNSSQIPNPREEEGRREEVVSRWKKRDQA